MVLFVCKANVGRSQIAEAFYNYTYGIGASMSIAGCEAKKEKYNGIPDKSISDFMGDNYSIDMHGQSIKYLSDIDKFIGEITKVVYLYNPKNYTYCDKECSYNEQIPYEYFITQNIPMEIYEVPDPFFVSKIGYLKIFQSILNITNSIR